MLYAPAGVAFAVAATALTVGAAGVARPYTTWTHTLHIELSVTGWATYAD